MSGVVVPTTMKSMSAGVSPARSIALHRRLARQVGRRDAGIDDVALADAGALQDPFVAGIDHLLEIGVGEHARRHVGRQAGDARAAQRARGGRRGYHSRESLPGAVSPKYS